MSKQTNILPQLLILAGCAAAYIRIRNREQQQPTLICNMNNNTNLPIGYRQNNPLNIRFYSHNNWKGHILPNRDGEFERFEDMTYGYRAAFVLLRNYIKQGYNTIEKIIGRWAPASENNVPAYINDVVGIIQRMSGETVSPSDIIARNDRATLSRLVYAMSIHENGYRDKAGNDILSTYGLPNMEIINQAWEMV